MIDNMYLLIVLILAFYATPGPAIISIVASGISFGFSRSVAYVWGIITGGIGVIAISLSGIILLIQVDERVFISLKYISLGYMLYLVYKIWISNPVEISQSQPLSYTNGIMLNLLNPKAYIVTVAFLLQFLDPRDQLTTGLILFFIILFSITVINFTFCYLGEVFYKLLYKKKFFSFVNKIMALILLATVIYIPLIQ